MSKALNMIKKKDYNNFMFIGKKIIYAATIRKIKKLKNYNDRADSLKYLVKSRLEMMVHKLEKKINKLKNEKKDTLIIELKRDILINKIKYFNSVPNKSDAKKILSIYNKMHKELKNVL